MEREKNQNVRYIQHVPCYLYILELAESNCLQTAVLHRSEFLSVTFAVERQGNTFT